MTDPVFFAPVEGHALLRSRGKYTEAPLYTRNGDELFAKQGSAFIRLRDNQATSYPGLFWSEVYLSHRTYGFKAGGMVLEAPRITTSPAITTGIHKAA